MHVAMIPEHTELPTVDRREHWVLSFAIEKGGTVRVSMHQRSMIQKLERKQLVTIQHLRPDGTEITVTDLGKQVAATPRPK